MAREFEVTGLKPNPATTLPPCPQHLRLYYRGEVRFICAAYLCRPWWSGGAVQAEGVKLHRWAVPAQKMHGWGGGICAG